MRIRSVLVEDEPLAMRSLRRLVDGSELLENVGEAGDGETALTMIDRLEPDLVLLDIKIPGLSGLEVLERCGGEPEVVFTTAFDRYAVAAFELGAIDYLVKPFGKERFEVAVERVSRRFRGAGRGADPGPKARLLATFGDGPVERLFSRRGDRVIPIAVREVSRAEARGEYVSVHAGGGSFLLHLTLSELESHLDPARFLRVHRSHLVNLDFVVEMRRHDDRRLLILLADGSEVLASRGGTQQLRQLIR